MKNQKGFTLVEMAIVLVIIGLLLGGVLKGQELIDNSKVKSISSDTSMMQAAINGYQDRFRAVPGDDGRATTNLPANIKLLGADVAIVNGNGNGLIDDAVAMSGAGVLAGEALKLVYHLTAANFLSLTAVTNDSFQSNAGYSMGVLPSVYGFGAAQLSVCYLNVPGKIVRQYESAYDDGYPNSGSVRTSAALTGATAPSATAGTTQFTQATDGSSFNMCVSIN